MKKILLMFALVLAIVGCKKEDTGLVLQDIVGLWQVTQIWDETNSKWENVPVGTMSAQFKADNTCAVSLLGPGTYTINGRTVVCKTSSQTVNLVFDDLNGNSATITAVENSKTLYKVKATRQ